LIKNIKSIGFSINIICCFIFISIKNKTGEVLEIGALWSIRVKDISSFERYIAQLKTYYHDYRYNIL